jgi:hypothetical protein
VERVVLQGAAGVAEQDHLRLRVLLQHRAHGGLVADRGVDQHGVVRVLAQGGDPRLRRRRPVDLGAPVVEQRSDLAAVGLVGGDEEQDERRLGHGTGADRTSLPKTEQ